MSSYRAKAVPGKPFTKDDPRINRKNGPKTQEAAEFGKAYKNALAKKITPNKLAEIIVKYAMLGRPWAIEMIHDDMVGKPTQPISGEMTHTLKFSFGQNGENGE